MKLSSILTLPILCSTTALAGFTCDPPGVFSEYDAVQPPRVGDYSANPDATLSFLCSDNIESVTLNLYLGVPGPGGVAAREGTGVYQVFPTNLNFLSAFSIDYKWTTFAGNSTNPVPAADTIQKLIACKIIQRPDPPMWPDRFCCAGRGP